MKDFIVNNYIIIIVIAAFLIFALIGFAVDTTKNKNNKESELLNRPNDDADTSVLDQVVDETNEIPNADE